MEKKEIKPMEKANVTPEVKERCLKILRAGIKNQDPFFWGVHAAEALTYAGHGDEVKALYSEWLKTDKDPKHRLGMARELYRAGDKSKASIILELLADPSLDVR